MKRKFLNFVFVFVCSFIAFGLVNNVQASTYSDGFITVDTDNIHKEFIDLISYEEFTAPVTTKFYYNPNNFDALNRTITFDKIEVTFSLSSGTELPYYEIGIFMGENYASFPNWISFVCNGEPSFYNQHQWLFYGVRNNVTVELSEEEWYLYTDIIERQNDIYSLSETKLPYNCYGYAIGYNGALEPGRLSGHTLFINYNFYDRIEDDLMAIFCNFRRVDESYVPQPYERMIAAMIFYDEGSYHFLKKSSNGTWTHTYPQSYAIYTLRGNPSDYMSGWHVENYNPNTGWSLSSTKPINYIVYYVYEI